MPKYILPKVTDADFVKLLQRINSFDNIEKEFKFSAHDRNVILGYLGRYFELNESLKMDSGGTIPNSDRNIICGRFKNNPSNVRIPFSQWQTFRASINTLSLSAVPGNCEIGLRFYIGTDNPADPTRRKYSVVIVPMYAPKISGTYDRDNEKEMKWFTDSGVSFFALKASMAGGSYSTSQTDCSALISKKDTFNREVAYFTLQDFEDFINSLIADPETLLIEFGRTSDHFATVVLSFLDSDGNLITSNLPSGGTAESIYFDQGDLIPPPPTDNVLRDTFFPR